MSSISAALSHACTHIGQQRHGHGREVSENVEMCICLVGIFSAVDIHVGMCGSCLLAISCKAEFVCCYN